MTTPQPPERLASDYRRAGDELIRLWATLPKAVTVRGSDDVLGRVLYGLATHVVSGARSVLILEAAGRTRDSYPIVRKCLEFGVMAQWINREGQLGVEAFGFESNRQAKALLKTLKEAKFDLPHAVAADFVIDVPKVDQADVVRNLEQVCHSFRGGAGLYLMYRSLSTDCHPSVSAVAMMLPGREDPDFDIAGSPAIALYTSTLGLLLAMRAADERTPGKPIKNDLQRISRRLGVPSMLASAPALPKAANKRQRPANRS